METTTFLTIACRLKTGGIYGRHPDLLKHAPQSGWFVQHEIHYFLLKSLTFPTRVITCFVLLHYTWKGIFKSTLISMGKGGSVSG